MTHITKTERAKTRGGKDDTWTTSEITLMGRRALNAKGGYYVHAGLAFRIAVSAEQNRFCTLAVDTHGGLFESAQRLCQHLHTMSFECTIVEDTGTSTMTLTLERGRWMALAAPGRALLLLTIATWIEQCYDLLKDDERACPVDVDIRAGRETAITTWNNSFIEANATGTVWCHSNTHTSHATGRLAAFEMRTSSNAPVRYIVHTGALPGARALYRLHDVTPEYLTRAHTFIETLPTRIMDASLPRPADTASIRWGTHGCFFGIYQRRLSTEFVLVVQSHLPATQNVMQTIAPLSVSAYATSPVYQGMIRDGDRQRDNLATEFDRYCRDEKGPYRLKPDLHFAYNVFEKNGDGFVFFDHCFAPNTSLLFGCGPARGFIHFTPAADAPSNKRIPTLRGLPMGVAMARWGVPSTKRLIGIVTWGALGPNPYSCADTYRILARQDLLFKCSGDLSIDLVRAKRDEYTPLRVYISSPSMNRLALRAWLSYPGALMQDVVAVPCDHPFVVQQCPMRLLKEYGSDVGDTALTMEMLVPADRQNAQTPDFVFFNVKALLYLLRASPNKVEWLDMN